MYNMPNYSYFQTPQSNETSQTYFLERTQSARLTLEKAMRICPQPVVTGPNGQQQSGGGSPPVAGVRGASTNNPSSSSPSSSSSLMMRSPLPSTAQETVPSTSVPVSSVVRIKQKPKVRKSVDNVFGAMVNVN